MKGFFHHPSCPYDFLVRFLTQGGKYPLWRREIVLRYTDKDKDIFKRYEKFDNDLQRKEYCQARYMPEGEKVPLAFLNAQDLQDYCRRKYPTTLAVGPVFPCVVDRDVERKSTELIKFAPIVFDVDMEDFLKDGRCTRSCKCENRAICDVCYNELLRPASLSLYHFLTEICQFKGVLMVYSGRRGFHCYILDRRVWDWSSEQRETLTILVPESVYLDKSVTVDPCHLVKPPLLPHQSTGILSCPIMDLNAFTPSRNGIHWSQVGQNEIDAWVRHMDNVLHLAGW